MQKLKAFKDEKRCCHAIMKWFTHRVCNMLEWPWFMIEGFILGIYGISGSPVNLLDYHSLSVVADPKTFDQNDFNEREILSLMCHIAGFALFSFGLFGMGLGFLGWFKPSDVFNSGCDNIAMRMKCEKLGMRCHNCQRKITLATGICAWNGVICHRSCV